MRVAMMQPTFLPWQGFFELIYKSERFVLGDESQWSVSSFHQRNRLFVERGKAAWFSVPVRKKESFGKPLNQTLIAEQPEWRQKMWRQIHLNYHKTEFFPLVGPLVERWLLTPAESLASQNIQFIRLVCDLLGIQREIRLGSCYPTAGHRSQRVADLLKWCEADQYYCARGSFPYMREDGLFPLEGVETLFQDFKAAPYPQIGAKGEFIPYLSVLDALFNIGPEGTLQLVVGGTENWWTWAEMLAAGDRSLSEDGEPCQEHM